MATAATTKPFKDRTPPDAPRCIVHGSRMQYAPDLADQRGMRCMLKGDDGKPCRIRAYPLATPPEKIRNTTYAGAMRLFVTTQDLDGTQDVTVYLQLIDLGVLIDVTAYVDMDRGGLLVPDSQGEPFGLVLQFANAQVS
jgi:hypothetical protein